jgi:hypothetical protein
MQRSTRSRATSAVALVVSLSLVVPATIVLPSSVAHAQGTKAPSKKDLEAARKNFMDGIDLENSGQWKEAKEKFDEVAKVRMTPEVRFHIALCEEHTGMLIEALRDFETAESDAKEEGKAAVMKEAPEHANAIKPRIPKLKVKAPSDVDGINLTLDGNAIDPKNEDEVPVNPGAHKISASADGRESFSSDVTLAEGESKTVVVKLPKTGGGGGDEEKPVEEPKPKEPETPQPTETHRKPSVLTWVAFGVGAVGLAGATIFFLKRNSIKSDLDGKCNADLHCPTSAQDDIDSGKSATTMANVFGAIGIVGVGAGIYLLLTAPKEEEAAPPKEESAGAKIRIVPGAPGANYGGLAITGSF